MTLTTNVPFTVPVPVEVEASAEGGFVARNDELRIAVIGATQQEAIESFQAGVRDLIDFSIERHLSLPAPLLSLLEPA